MTDQARDIYRVYGSKDHRELESQLNMLLARLADRLDRMEGLRGNPRFYKTTFDMVGAAMSAGQVLRATGTEQAEVSSLDVAEVVNAAPSIPSGDSAQIDLERSLISLIDAENDTVVHQFPTQWLEYNCEVFMFTTNEAFEELAWSLDGDVSGPGSSVNSNVAEFSGTSGKVIKDGGLSHASVLAATTHQVAEDAISGLIQGNGVGGYSAATALSGNLLVSIYDINEVIVHQFPIEFLGYNSDVFGFVEGTTELPTLRGINTTDSIVSPNGDLTIYFPTDKTIVLNETVWDDLSPSPIIAAKAGSSAPTLATFVGNVEQYTFDATNDFVIGATEITHKWKEGTVIHPHVHWATNGTNANDRGVKWSLEYTIGDNTETFSGAATTTVDATIPLATADRTHFITGFDTTIDGANIKIGAYICWKFHRVATAHANGAPANDPFGIAVGFHIECDTIGSRTISAK